MSLVKSRCWICCCTGSEAILLFQQFWLWAIQSQISWQKERECGMRAPWDLQRHRRNLKQMDCEGLDGCHVCALYLACINDYIHSCNLRAWQCGSGPAWPTFDISLWFTRAPAKVEWQTNTRCMPCLLMWGFKLSTAGMTLQQYICKYMNMERCVNAHVA